MKKLILFLIGLLSFKQLLSQQLWQINKDTIINWYYADGDEFNDSILNLNKWDYQFGWARSIAANKEQQYYTDGKNHELKNGCLHLFALNSKTDAKLIDYLAENDSIFIGEKFNGFNKRTFEYLSGMIQSKSKYQYGYFEIKCKFPKEKGFWPAFWLYGGTPNEEIDWLEGKTEKPNKIHVGRHSKIKSENKFRSGLSLRKKWWGNWIRFNGNLSNGFHIISGEWNPDYIKFYLNGECIAYTQLKMKEYKHVVINLAVPSNDGSFKPGPEKNLTESIHFEIDYVRIWKNNKPTADSKITFTNQFNPPIEIQRTKLISKSTMHYGKKSIHKNEGFTISVFPIGNDEFELSVFGKNIPENAKLKFFENDIVFQEEKINYGIKKVKIKSNQRLYLNVFEKDIKLW
jgi:beta-glucanase (GH16 family)